MEKAAIEKKVQEIKDELADLDKEKVLAIAKEKAAAIKEKCNISSLACHLA